jgi:hypothetical protein
VILSTARNLQDQLFGQLVKYTHVLPVLLVPSQGKIVPLVIADMSGGAPYLVSWRLRISIQKELSFYGLYNE